MKRTGDQKLKVIHDSVLIKRLLEVGGSWKTPASFLTFSFFQLIPKTKIVRQLDMAAAGPAIKARGCRNTDLISFSAFSRGLPTQPRLVSNQPWWLWLCRLQFSLRWYPPRYQLLAITWLLISLLPQPPTGSQRKPPSSYVSFLLVSF